MLFFVSYGNSCSMEFDNPERPECNNLLSIYQLVSEKTKEVINFIWVFIRLMPLIIHRFIYINFYLWKFEYHMEMTDNIIVKKTTVISPKTKRKNITRRFEMSYRGKPLLLQEVAQECRYMNWGTFKSVLSDVLIDHLHPIQVSISTSHPFWSVMFSGRLICIIYAYWWEHFFFLLVGTVHILSFYTSDSACLMFFIVWVGTAIMH